MSYVVEGGNKLARDTEGSLLYSSNTQFISSSGISVFLLSRPSSDNIRPTYNVKAMYFTQCPSLMLVLKNTPTHTFRMFVQVFEYDVFLKTALSVNLYENQGSYYPIT